jgi:hypothetical protein
MNVGYSSFPLPKYASLPQVFVLAEVLTYVGFMWSLYLIGWLFFGVVYDKACSYTRTPNNTHVILELDYELTRGVTIGILETTWDKKGLI